MNLATQAKERQESDEYITYVSFLSNLLIDKAKIIVISLSLSLSNIYIIMKRCDDFSSENHHPRYFLVI